MKRILFITSLCFISIALFAGGLVTNNAQSAMFTRFQCRDATINIDAAFYNPAGLIHFSDGFFLSVNNLSLGEAHIITSDYDNFENPQEFKGKVLTPVFPSVYAVYKTGRFAFSGGVNLIGGRGSVKYENSLPSVKRRVADLIPYLRNSLASVDDAVTNVTGTDPNYSNITAYDIESEYISRSLYPGLQFNTAYMINNKWSAAVGLRLIRGSETYIGGITNVKISGTNRDGSFSLAPADYLRAVSSSVGDTVAPSLSAATTLAETRSRFDLDVIQKGYGITPVLSVNYAPSLYTNWSLKYEFKTKLSLITQINDSKSGAGMFTDGNEVISDIPAMLSFGLTRRPTNKFMYYLGLHYYFDKPIDFDGSDILDIDMIEKNSYELAFGAEYKLSSSFRLSAGWLMNRPGVNKEYQSERRFSLPSNTIGAGFGLRISELIDFNAGISYTLYKKEEKTYSYTPEVSAEAVEVSEYYDKRTFVLALGLDFLFGEN